MSLLGLAVFVAVLTGLYHFSIKPMQRRNIDDQRPSDFSVLSHGIKIFFYILISPMVFILLFKGSELLFQLLNPKNIKVSAEDFNLLQQNLISEIDLIKNGVKSVKMNEILLEIEKI